MLFKASSTVLSAALHGIGVIHWTNVKICENSSLIQTLEKPFPQLDVGIDEYSAVDLSWKLIRPWNLPIHFFSVESHSHSHLNTPFPMSDALPAYEHRIEKIPLNLFFKAYLYEYRNCNDSHWVFKHFLDPFDGRRLGGELATG